MSLNDCLARRRAAETSSPETPAPPPAPSTAASAKSPAGAMSHAHAQEKQGGGSGGSGGGLLLRCWNRVIWTFPWTHFMEAQFEPAATSGADFIRLIFGKREVTLRGRNLSGLMEPIARQSVAEVREIPEAHITPADAESGTPVVWEISVVDHAERREKQLDKKARKDEGASSLFPMQS